MLVLPTTNKISPPNSLTSLPAPFEVPTKVGHNIASTWVGVYVMLVIMRHGFIYREKTFSGAFQMGDFDRFVFHLQHALLLHFVKLEGGWSYNWCISCYIRHWSVFCQCFVSTLRLCSVPFKIAFVGPGGIPSRRYFISCKVFTKLDVTRFYHFFACLSTMFKVYWWNEIPCMDGMWHHENFSYIRTVSIFAEKCWVLFIWKQ